MALRVEGWFIASGVPQNATADELRNFSMVGN
jgi:hypothetical protein